MSNPLSLAPARYVDYLLEAVRGRELFTWVRLEPEAWWHALLLRDRYNLLGLAARLPAAAHDALSQHPGALTQVRARLGVSTRSSQHPGAVAPKLACRRAPCSTRARSRRCASHHHKPACGHTVAGFRRKAGAPSAPRCAPEPQPTRSRSILGFRVDARPLQPPGPGRAPPRRRARGPLAAPGRAQASAHLIIKSNRLTRRRRVQARTRVAELAPVRA